MIDYIILNHKLKDKRNGIGNGIVPGKCRWQTVKYEQQYERKNVRHVLHSRIARIWCIAHIVYGNKETRNDCCQHKQADVVSQSKRNFKRQMEKLADRRTD